MNRIIVSMIFLACLTVTGQAAVSDKPNLIVIVADDIGPGDIGFYHRERTGKPEVIPTPNLDRLISEGMRFDDAHSAAPLCAPSRFGMMTGTYSFRNYKPYGVWGPWEKTGVDPKFTTSARIAKRAGYATAFFGKSGMGGAFKSSGSSMETSWKERYKKYDLKVRTVGPNQLGFDYSFELPSGIQNAPMAYYENNAWYPIKPDSTFKLIGPKQSGYATSRKHNDLEEIGDSNWDPSLAGPMLAEKAKAYIERQVAASPKQPFFMYYCTQAVHIPHTPPQELDGIKIAGTTPGPHGDMVRELDAQIGVLIKSLKKAGVYKNTLFIFTSDNGGLAPDPEASNLGHDPTNGWTGAKGTITEGGHRVPFIASWPGVIAPGTRADETISALDVVATIAAVTGQKISHDQVMDSVNLMPLLTQEPDAKGHTLLMHYSAKGKAALRQGDWKLHVYGENLKNIKPKHLFNLKTNPTEDVEKDYLDDPEYRERAERMLETFRQSLKKPTVTLCALASLAQGQTETQTTIFNFEGSFNYQNVKRNNAQVGITRGRTGKALQVWLKKDYNASITLKSQGWQVSHHAGVAMDITNTGINGIGIIAEASINNTKTSLESFVWVEPGKTETLFIVFRRKQPPKYMDKYFVGMRGLPGPFLSHWLTPDLNKLNSLKLYTAKTNKNVRFQVDNVRGIGEYATPTEDELNSDFFPFVDKFGQYIHRQWPGKTTSQDDIDNQHKEELKELVSNQGPDDWNKYGGWETGPKLKATGHFRTEKIDEKWWLVDPEGRLFWSQGITGVRISQATRIWGREKYFAEKPEYNDFREANLKRKFGDDWKSQVGPFIHRRLRSWGINTFANWSDKEIYNLRKTPYVVSMGSSIAKEMPNILDETEFRNKVRKRINAKTVDSFKDDPWCLGVFVDNELRWPKKNTAAVAETYYKVVSEELKKVAPNILYLGSRIHGSGGPLPPYIAASKYCDVVSINRYKFVVTNEDLPKGSVDKPMIIGEFHFGALDRGLLHTGLKGVIDQKQRANAYTFYLRQALQNDRIVGAHWFQHTDQLVSARADGENYQIGFVDIADKPYPEMISASRKLAQYLYQYRKTGSEPKKKR